MKNTLYVCVILFLSAACTEKSSNPAAEPVTPIESAKTHSYPEIPAKDIIPINEPSQVKGMKIQFSDSKKEGDFYYITELKVIEEKSGKLIDQFPELIWGNSVIQANEDSITWSLSSGKGSEVSVTYSVNTNGEVIKKGKCHLFDDPQADTLYAKALPKIEDNTADWESTVSQLQKLAVRGNKEAFNFFMSPNLQQKKYEKYNDGAASFMPAREVLRFMKESAGCQWK